MEKVGGWRVLEKLFLGGERGKKGEWVVGVNWRYGVWKGVGLGKKWVGRVERGVLGGIRGG